jgi:hypothetical protein
VLGRAIEGRWEPARSGTEGVRRAACGWAFSKARAQMSLCLSPHHLALRFGTFGGVGPLGRTGLSLAIDRAAGLSKDESPWLNDVIQIFLGNRDKKEPSKKEADQIVKILEPVARTTAANLALDLMVQSHLTPLRSSARFTFTTTAKKRTQCRTTRGVISGRRCRQNSRHAG